MIRAVALAALGGLWLAPSIALAQNPQPAPPGSTPTPVAPPNSPSPPPEKIAPGGLDPSGQQTLSDKLSQQHGTLHPPSVVDPGMTVAPKAHGTMPVIPPPGTPGGNQAVIPK